MVGTQPIHRLKTKVLECSTARSRRSMSPFERQMATSSRCFSRGRIRAGASLRGMTVPELGDAQRGHEAECRRWHRAHMPIFAIGIQLARAKAPDWAMVTAEDLGQRIQAFAIAMAELVGVDEVKRAGVP